MSDCNLGPAGVRDILVFRLEMHVFGVTLLTYFYSDI